MAQNAPRRILIVEDEVDLAESFQAGLREAGYEVTIASDGYDALEQVASGTFDLITMDLRMPRLGGIQATELIRMRRISTPIIVISGYVANFEDELRQLQVRCILYKPIGLKTLIETVRRVLEEDRGPNGERP